MQNVVERYKKLQDWKQTYEQLHQLKYQDIYKTPQSFFKKKQISRGTEGVVYKTRFDYKIKLKKTKSRGLECTLGYNDYFIIKALYLKRIKDRKSIDKSVLYTQPDKIKQIFYSKHSFNKPSLVELISLQLTNQLVLQKICPHYILNYDWDYDKNVIRQYNEYATSDNFYNWAEQNHSDELWLNALFQIMVSVLAIKRYFNMIHTDLHLKNILIHKVNPGGYWTYIINDRKYYLPNLGYIFLLSDFGYAWIPQKLGVPSHYKNIMQHTTVNGRNIYDIIILIKSLKNIGTVPKSIIDILEQTFPKTEFIIFTKEYYEKIVNELDKKQTITIHKSPNVEQKSSVKRMHKYIIENYNTLTQKKPNLSKKIKTMFYNTYQTKPKKQKHIESYSLDKSFGSSKLHKQFRNLVKKETLN